MAYEPTYQNQQSSIEDSPSFSPDGENIIIESGIGDNINTNISPEDAEAIDINQISFGRPEDTIELHILDAADNVVFSESNFIGYTSPKVNNSGLIEAINIDPEDILKSKGYITSNYKLKFNFLRKKIINSEDKEFIIKEISSTRTELKILTPNISITIMIN